MKTKYTSQTAPKPSWKNAILLAITALALSASPGSRADQLCNCLRYWDNSGTGDWFVASNWGPNHNDVPGCSGVLCPPLSGASEVDINNGGTAQITTATTASACEVFLGKDSGQSGTLSVVGPGTLNQCNDMFVGYYGKGTLSITNGGSVSTLMVASIAAATGSSGSATVDGTNSTWTVTGAAVLRVGGILNGNGGTGLLTVTNSGTVSAVSIYVYKSGTLTGNGTVSTPNGTTTIEGTLAPSGTLTISGDLRFPVNTSNMRSNVSSTSVDTAEVSGAATLNGKLSVTLNGFFTGDFTLLHADGGLGNTTFSSYSFTYTGCLSPSIVYHTNDVILHVESSCQ